MIAQNTVRQLSRHSRSKAFITGMPVRLLPSQIRTLVYVNTSSSASSSSTSSLNTKRPIRGLKKSLDQYLISNGIKYPGNDLTLEPILKLLGPEFALPKELILQVLTHKSFAHGLKPYNENLAIIGRHFLRLYTISHAVNQKNNNPQAVNGLNFDVATSKISALMSSSTVTSILCRRLGIDKQIFWKDPSDTYSEVPDKVCSKTMDALVGAVIMKLGQQKAQKFIDTQLLQNDETSLLKIAKEVYK